MCHTVPSDHIFSVLLYFNCHTQTTKMDAHVKNTRIMSSNLSISALQEGKPIEVHIQPTLDNLCIKNCKFIIFSCNSILFLSSRIKNIDLF